MEYPRWALGLIACLGRDITNSLFHPRASKTALYTHSLRSISPSGMGKGAKPLNTNNLAQIGEYAAPQTTFGNVTIRNSWNQNGLARQRRREDGAAVESSPCAHGIGQQKLAYFRVLSFNGHRLREWAAGGYGASVPNPSGTVGIELWRMIRTRARPAREGLLSPLSFRLVFPELHKAHNPLRLSREMPQMLGEFAASYVNSRILDNLERRESQGPKAPLQPSPCRYNCATGVVEKCRPDQLGVVSSTAFRADRRSPELADLQRLLRVRYPCVQVRSRALGSEDSPPPVSRQPWSPIEGDLKKEMSSTPKSASRPQSTENNELVN